MPRDDSNPEDFRFVTGPVREGSRPVHLYNEGLVIFYYDASRLERVQAVGPTILEYFNEDVLRDEKLDELFEDGSLVVHLLAGDGGADLEVVTGHDLTEEEKEGGRWLEPRSAWIALPSGRLRIETYNSAPFSDGDEPGGEVRVPPGDYLLTVHSKDWTGMEMEDGDDVLERAEEAGIEVYDGERVDDVIVLTSLDEGEDRPSRGILFEDLYTAEPEPWPSPGGEVLFEGWAGTYHDGTFEDEAGLEGVGAGMAELGMEPLGDFVLDRFGGVQVRGWAGAGLPFHGIVHKSAFSGLTVDLYTRFDDGTSLTTSTIAAPEDPEHGIFRRSRAGGSVEELHETHMEALAEHAEAGRAPVEPGTTRLGVIEAIDEFLARQQG
ncbi:MAG: hypothetical protein GWM92_20580 [Gemmatimonadetes bacterium]|nr:hypothetical protein [Gemmatimonadota bacterium]NIR81234.1 hypothetical protein [Gemmatimonadota bacterium]NIT90079.1 hypothetical protein [Gemmatimonadota bacterium]NIU33891.1 hypothetical protein [Gemmatimonadota bacterium]NIU38083.1 hypothetical protein [Gemmatimonadota bacterium]